MNPLIAWAFLAWWAIALIVLLVTVAAALFHPRFRVRRPASDAQPPVTVIVPLSGIDPELETNLHSIFRQDYPEFDVLFSVADADDPAKAVAERIAAQYPQIASDVVIGASDQSSNPKTNNVLHPLERAKHNVVFMTDSNVVSRPDRLASLVRHLTDDCGLVSSTAFGVRPASFWGEVECAVLNPYHSRYLLTADLGGFGFALGKTLLFRRSDFEKAGGAARLAAGAAEDAELTVMMRSLGLTVVFAEQAVEHPVGARRFSSLWNRHLRWFIYRRIYAWPSYLLETSGGALTATIAGAIGVYGVFGWSPAVFVPLSLAGWLAVEALYLVSAGGRLSWRTPIASLVREALLPAIWTATLFRWNAAWRSR